jgi:hypothetical protein
VEVQACKPSDSIILFPAIRRIGESNQSRLWAGFPVTPLSDPSGCFSNSLTHQQIPSNP